MQFPDNEAIDLGCSDLMEIEEILYEANQITIVITAISSLGKIKTASLTWNSLNHTTTLYIVLF